MGLHQPLLLVFSSSRRTNAASPARLRRSYISCVVGVARDGSRDVPCQKDVAGAEKARDGHAAIDDDRVKPAAAESERGLERDECWDGVVI